MTHVDDGDWTLDELAERQIPEQEPPLDLDEIENAYKLADVMQVMGPHTQMAFSAVPDLIAELREARQRIAEWEALPTREEWTVTEDSSTPPAARHNLRFTADGALSFAAQRGEQAWRQVVIDRGVVHPWEPIDEKAPF